MDNTLIYSLVAGVGIVLLFVAARFAFRWLVRLAIIGVIVVALSCAVWVWFNSSSSASKPHISPSRSNTQSQH